MRTLAECGHPPGCPHRWTDEELDRLRELAPTRSHAEIAEILGRSRSSVKSHCVRLGIKGRPRGDYGQGFSTHPYVRRGPDNPRWNPDRDAVRRTGKAEWRELRFAVLKRDGYRCVKCGLHVKKAKAVTGHSLHIHHVDENPSNDEISNLVTMCQPHHMQEHKREVVSGQPR